MRDEGTSVVREQAFAKEQAWRNNKPGEEQEWLTTIMASDNHGERTSMEGEQAVCEKKCGEKELSTTSGDESDLRSSISFLRLYISFCVESNYGNKSLFRFVVTHHFHQQI